MKFYRIGNKNRDKDVHTAFAGEGGIYGEGRWHLKGTPVIYAATTPELALVEILVHRRPRASVSYPLYVIDIPEKWIEIAAPKLLPKNWDSVPPTQASRALGDAWLHEKSSIGLLVPSVIVPLSLNCIINPLHPKFDIRWAKGPLEFSLDSRLLYD